MTSEADALTLPSIALAVRQPWAWAIIHGGKDIENRNSHSVSLGGMKPGRIAILASRGMTRAEYEEAVEFMEGLGVACPHPADLLRGGIVGEVRVTGIVRESDSPWFFGPRGLVLADAKPCAFVAAIGELGYFQWRRHDAGAPSSLPWMVKYRRAPSLAAPLAGTLL